MEAYRTKLSPMEYRLLCLIHVTPNLSRGQLAASLYVGEEPRDPLSATGVLVARLKKNLADLHAPFIIRSKQWKGYWIEPTVKPQSSLKSVIAHGLRDYYHNSEFCVKLADNVLASLAEVGLPRAALEGVVAGTHIVVKKQDFSDFIGLKIAPSPSDAKDADHG